MDSTDFMIKLLGVYFLVIGVGIFSNRDLFKGIVREFTKKTTGAGFRGFAGVVNLIVGLLIVLNHNVWEDVPTIIVSLTGWIALLKGAGYIVLPNFSVKAVEIWGERYAVAGFLSIVIGAYLIFLGFFAPAVL